MGQLKIVLVRVTQSVQTRSGSTLMSMETGLWLIVLKWDKEIKRHKKLNDMSPKPVIMSAIFS